jgi:hypothetical protein
VSAAQLLASKLGNRVAACMCLAFLSCPLYKFLNRTCTCQWVSVELWKGALHAACMSTDLSCLKLGIPGSTVMTCSISSDLLPPSLPP